MKKCPQCSRTYPDDTLAFCLEDGSLLSASFDPRETNAPTFLLNTVDVSLDKPRANPAVVTSPARTGGAGWLVYLAGLLISVVFDLVYVFKIYPYYAEATRKIFDSIGMSFESPSVGYAVAGFIVSTPLNVLVYSVFAFLLALLWPRGGWKWGFIALLPNFAFTIYYFGVNLTSGYFEPPYYIRAIIANIIYLTAACLFAWLGSKLSPRRRD